VGPRAELDEVVKRKSPCPCEESNPGRPDRSLVTILTEIFPTSNKNYYFYLTALFQLHILYNAE
jgi:hypothetical protein